MKMVFLDLSQRRSSDIIITYSLILFADYAAKPITKVSLTELE
jgi:hypothetical protein